MFISVSPKRIYSALFSKFLWASLSLYYPFIDYRFIHLLPPPRPRPESVYHSVWAPASSPKKVPNTIWKVILTSEKHAESEQSFYVGLCYKLSQKTFSFSAYLHSFTFLWCQNQFPIVWNFFVGLKVILTQWYSKASRVYKSEWLQSYFCQSSHFCTTACCNQLRCRQSTWVCGFLFVLFRWARGSTNVRKIVIGKLVERTNKFTQARPGKNL